MIKLIWRTDVHLADKNPQSRTDSWFRTTLGKLHQVGQAARSFEADAVIDGGDFFHVKSPFRNSHHMLRVVADLHAFYPCPVYAVIGNHDCVYGDMRYLEKQPLGVLYSTGVFKRLYDKHELIIEKDGIKVRVVGIPYHGPNYEMNRLKGIKKGDEDYLIVAAHLLASPKGGSMFDREDIVSYNALRELDPDVFMFGHWHQDQGIVQIAPGKQVVNIGSLTRGSISQDELSRRPAIATLTITKGEIRIEKIPLQVQPPEKVFDLVGHERKQMSDGMIEEFVGSLHETLSEADKMPLMDLVRSIDVDPTVRERAISYLERYI